MSEIKDCKWCKGRYRCSKHPRGNRFDKKLMVRVMEKLLDEMILDKYNRYVYYRNKNDDVYSLKNGTYQFRWY